MVPGAHLARSNRVRVMSHHIQPCIETAKAGIMEQKQRTLHTGKLDPLFMIIALMSRCWCRAKGREEEGNSSTPGILQSLTWWETGGKSSRIYSWENPVPKLPLE